MPIVEFVWWSSTDEFLADYDHSFKPTVDYVSAMEGCLKIYYGLEEEDVTNFWMVVVWQTRAHHQTMMDRSDYPAMVAGLKPFFRDGQLKMNHVEFNNSTSAAFGAPVSTILFLNLKENRERESVERALQVFSKAVDNGSNSYSPVAWGQTQEDDRKSILVIGRNGLQDDVNPPIAGLHKILDVQAIHVKFADK